MDADPKLAFLAARLHPCRLDGAVEDAHGVIDLIYEAAPGFGEAGAARVAVEKGTSSGTHAR